MNFRRRIFRYLIFGSALAASFPALEAATPSEQSAAALARRVLGPAATHFRFEQIQADQGRDVFELDA